MISKRFEALPTTPVLSIFFTAGYPRLEDTVPVLSQLQASGVDMVEIGFPFSDPVADGPTIQRSNQVALENGMTVRVLFQQLLGMRGSISIPILLMGYLNPALQFGFERFLEQAAAVGVDALIIPDLPFMEYQRLYADLYKKYGISPVFLVTARTQEERIREFDAADPAFLYVVSSDATTGGKAAVTAERTAFFARLKRMELKSRLIVGFGVSDRESFEGVTKDTNGAIVGSAFLRMLADVPAGSTCAQSLESALQTKISSFVSQYR